MTLPKLFLACLCLTLITAVCGLAAFAQEGSMALAATAWSSTAVGVRSSRDALLKDMRNAPQPFSTDVAGSLRGRVLHELYAVPAVEPQAVGGVRLILRSADEGSQAIVGHRITDASGNYEFETVTAGKYLLEVDPISVPTRVRSSGILVSRIGFERSLQSNVPIAPMEQNMIQGFVFIDRDGDGQYDPGKDQPVSGAQITGNGRFTVSNPNGSYTLRDLPTGRTGVLVTLPRTNDYTHLVLDLRSGPAAMHIVNVPLNF